MNKPETIFTLKNKITNLEVQRSKTVTKYENSIDKLDYRIKKAKQTLDYKMNGLDLHKMELGGKIIKLHGVCDSPRRLEAKEEAIDDLLLNRGEYMKTTFIGVKRYDGFGDQACNCNYGYGPTHGGIVFSIGIKEEYRKKLMTDEELESAVYYIVKTLK